MQRWILFPNLSLYRESLSLKDKIRKTSNVYSFWFIETWWYLEFMPSMEFTYHKQTSIVSIFLYTPWMTAPPDSPMSFSVKC